MKLLLITICVVASVSAAPNLRSVKELTAMRALPAVEHEEVHDEFGQYALRYVTAEGIVVSERGRLVPAVDGEGYVLIIEGETSYIGDDGELYNTKYTAGLDGTKVESNHLPVAPNPVVTDVLPVPQVPFSESVSAFDPDSDNY